ncbi:sodium-dependent neutral amino acid transporter SLC6A17-like [Salvelinus sp. IW2-2015]|uniref:sodium-dependent neutral amino acid transporter SLC6A17-like n=1 Tax=Salvelinus sp. IW2-2015 TaxID=2691554 RepID=UPI0038D419FA
MLKGSVDGIAHMFTTKLEKMLEPQVWREAATQVFFALGLGFGGVIAFSSYNKRDNNCHFDAALVSIINFITSILATLVVFAVLGFKANIMNEKCVVE